MASVSSLSKKTASFIFMLASILLGFDLIFALLHILVHAWNPQGNLDFLIKLFDLDTEANLPTWFASVEWLAIGVSAGLSWMLEKRTLLVENRKRSWFWLVIAFVFTVASADEVATIHEEMGTFLQNSVNSISAGGQPLSPIMQQVQAQQAAPGSPWLLYYVPLLAVFGLLALVFLLQRLAPYKVLLIAFLLGPPCYATALALDHYQGKPDERRTELASYLDLSSKQLDAISVVIEETLENVGSSFLIVSFGGYAHHLFLRYLDQSKTLPQC